MKEFENRFLKLSYIEKDNMCHEVWNDTTEEMTNEEWMQTRHELAALFLENTPDKLLADTRKFKFALTPELQDWLAENITSKIGSLIKKIAIILPEELIVQLGVEQLMEEKQTGQIVSRYFEDEVGARKWLEI